MKWAQHSLYFLDQWEKAASSALTADKVLYLEMAEANSKTPPVTNLTKLFFLEFQETVFPRVAQTYQSGASKEQNTYLHFVLWFSGIHREPVTWYVCFQQLKATTIKWCRVNIQVKSDDMILFIKWVQWTVSASQ